MLPPLFLSQKFTVKLNTDGSNNWGQHDAIPICNWGEPKIRVPLEQDVPDQDILIDSNSSSWRPSHIWQDDGSLPERKTHASVSDVTPNIFTSEQLDVSKFYTGARIMQY
jgi:hypothetical protein